MKPILLITSFAFYTLSVFTQTIVYNADSSIVFKKSEQAFEACRTNKIIFNDFDLDGDKDMIWANMGLNYSKMWHNDGKGKFSESSQNFTQQGHGVDLGDLDLDGDLDMVITCAGWTQKNVDYSLPTKIYLNDGNGKYTDSNQNLGDSLLSGNSIKLFDIDMDNDLDIFIVYYKAPDLIYLNNGKGIFIKSNIEIPEHCTWHDLDNDKDIDMLVSDYNSNLKVYLNNGKGTFSENWTYEDTNIVRGFTEFADIDNDGDIDFIRTNATFNELHPTIIFKNNGTGKFTKSQQELNVAKIGKIAFGDVNNDSFVDLVITNFTDEHILWINDSKGNFIDSGIHFPNKGKTCFSPTLEDIDNDGDLDFIIADFFGGENEIWFQQN
jgi:FG-GAP-like repeat